MAYIITEPCIGTCDTSCVEVCPVDCIKGPDNADDWSKPDNPEGKQLYIDPDTCIDCGVCEPECPVDAIFEEALLPEDQKKYIDINAIFFVNSSAWSPRMRSIFASGLFFDMMETQTDIDQFWKPINGAYLGVSRLRRRTIPWLNNQGIFFQ